MNAPAPVATPLAPREEQPQRPEPFGLYLHIPFCIQKCPYCDFNTYARLDHLHQTFVDALCREMVQWARHLSTTRIATVFIGGGTPTVLRPEQLTQILETVQEHFRLQPDCEITCEANPGAVDREKFTVLRSLGVNRLSMGVQSFQPEELAFLGRAHSVEDVYAAYAAARSAGFDNINLDFIFGLPQQAPENWAATLEEALALAPEHLSLYSLIVEPNTPLHHWVEGGRVPPPDEDEAAALYEWAMERLDQAGYVHYEVSNWAWGEAGQGHSPHRACWHNLIYWRNGVYLGVGPGAHSHMFTPVRLPGREEGDREEGTVDRAVALRWANHRPVPGYIRRVTETGCAVAEEEAIDPATSMGETMMMGLRLLQEGVSAARFLAQHGRTLQDVYGPQLQRFQAQGLLTWDGERARLTRRGLMVANQVAAAFLP